ncbi:TRAP transporter large permease subunit [Hwanghaeella sp.]|uniref:TRAP transporter large permease n=1 Tax=Hwanghaeella sp. TaxID=2605943 RepID=UPI003CCC2E14
MQSAGKEYRNAISGDPSPEQGDIAPMRRAVHRLLGFLDGVIGSVATIALMSLIVIVFANVIGRYVFNNSLTWASEAAQWLFVGVIFLAVPLAHRSRMHLSITMLVDRLSGGSRTLVDFLADVILAWTTISLLFGGTYLIEVMGGTNYVLALPVWVKFIIIPVSCILALVYQFLRGIDENVQPWRAPLAVVVGFALHWAMNDGNLITILGIGPAATMAIGFVVAMALGAPVAFAMLFATFLANEAGQMMPPAAVVQNMVNGSSKFLLLAVPFFITAGAMMNIGGLTERLMDFAFKLVGHFRGGFAQVNIVSSLFYAGISGSSYSEAALGAKLLVPQMIRHGYAPGFSCAVTAAGATLPNVIPPSIALLILAAASNLSVGHLWLAGVGPGLLMAFALMICIYIISRRRGYGTANSKADWNERGSAFLQALPVLGLAVLILGGIRFGVVTPTEAGVLAVVYAMFLGIFVYRAYALKDLWRTLRTAAIESALVGLLIGAAAPFAFVLVTENVPQALTQFVTGLSDNLYVVLILVNVLMLLFGMFLDIGAAILILTPLLMPVMVSLGMDPIHFGLVIVVNLILGGLTPPVGMLAFITGTVSKTPVHVVFRAMYPMLGALILALLLVSFVPAISLGPGWLLSGK